MEREGAVHHGIELRFEGRGHRIDLTGLTGGREIMVYGQQEVVKDLYRTRLEAGGQIIFGAAAVGLEDLDTQKPKIRFRRGAQLGLAGGAVRFHGNSEEEELTCDFVAGCDGFFGACRLLADLSAPRLESAALLLVDDFHVAPLRQERLLPVQPADRRA